MRFHSFCTWVLGFTTAQFYFEGGRAWMTFFILSVFFVFSREPIWGD